MIRWFVYIIKCVDGSLYTGITNNIELRITEHNMGKGAKYTKGRGPVIIKHSETVENKSLALKREYEIKQMSKEEKLLLCKKGK